LLAQHFIFGEHKVSYDMLFHIIAVLQKEEEVRLHQRLGLEVKLRITWTLS